MSKTKWHTKAIYLVVALVMTLGLLMVPATQPTEVAANPDMGVAWTSCHYLNDDGDAFGSVTMTDAEAKYGDWSAELTADQEPPGDGTGSGDYGKLIVDVCPLAFADLAEFSFWVEGGAAAQDLPLHEIELAAISEDVTLPTGSNVLGDAPPDIAAWNTIGATLSATTNRVSIAYQPGDAGKKTNATAGFEKFGTHADAAIDASDEAWAIFWDSDNDGSFDKSAGYYTWAEIHSAFDGKATVGDVRVELRWPPGGDTTVWVDDVVIDDTRYPIEPDLIPEIAYDVKGSEQKFFVNCCCLEDPWVPGTLPLAVDNWDVTPGLNLHSVGLPGEGKDITVEQGGKPGIGGDVVQGPDNYIGVSATQPGDCSISVTITGTNGPYTYTAEKKWGVIDYTILDLDVVTAGQQLDVVHDAGAVGDPETEKFSDTVYASFLKSVGTFTTTAGHAIVHWWLIKDTVVDGVHVNEVAIDEIMLDLGAEGCGDYADLYAATGESPKDLIDEVWTADPADYTTFTDVQEGITDTDLPLDPNIDASFNVLDDTYIKTMTEDDFPCQTRGLTEVEVSNTGAEQILVVSYTEYPHNYHGENPVCVEKGRKTWGPVPPPAEVKTTQVRWAGEKIVLEKDWSGIAPSVSYVALYNLEGESIGDLEVAGDNTSVFTGPDQVAVAVNASPDDWVSEVILKSEQQGEADVNCSLYAGSISEGVVTLTGSPIANTGFVVYYLFIEEVTPWEPEPEAVEPEEDAVFAVDVKGCFWTSSLPPTTREAKTITFESDTGPQSYVLPAGRYVLPDDWPLMAGPSWRTQRPWMDLMATPGWLGGTVSSTYELGPYSPVNSPSGIAALPCIGPFSSLQQWSDLDMWITDAVVPADGATDMDPYSALYGSWDTRCTVIPDDFLDWFDCPMPPAEIHFVITASVPPAGVDASLTTALKNTGPTYDWPFYAAEIPASLLIPPMKGTVEGYWWDSWEFDTYTPEDASEQEGPYWFYDDLEQTPLVDTVNTRLEAYSDNLGACAVYMDALGGAGSVTIKAIADYPYLPAKFGAVESDEVTQNWGAIELNPHFEADKTDVALGETVTFDNLTTLGTLPYTKAEWDFNADGTIDLTITGTHAEVMADAEWAYLSPGLKTVRLWMTDSTPTTRYEERPFYITVAGVAAVTWTCGIGGQPLISPYPAQGRPFLAVAADCSGITVSAGAELWGIYWLNEVTGDWLYYIPGYTSTLTSLEPGKYYYVVVSAPCTLTIPQ